LLAVPADQKNRSVQSLRQWSFAAKFRSRSQQTPVRRESACDARVRSPTPKRSSPIRVPRTQSAFHRHAQRNAFRRDARYHQVFRTFDTILSVNADHVDLRVGIIGRHKRATILFRSNDQNRIAPTASDQTFGTDSRCHPPIKRSEVIFR
jgi:hypothetical protein